MRYPQGGFEEYQDLPTKSGFTLRGTKVLDESDDGDLFVSTPPRINVESGIIWTRVGEEQQDGWRGENFNPAEKSLEDVLEGRQGRFFLRGYDETGMRDSEAFRYFAGLCEIRVNGKPYEYNLLLTPSLHGHRQTALQFVDRDGTTIHPELGNDNSHATLGANGFVTIAPDAGGDKVVCGLGSGANKTEVVINLPRVWWRIIRHDSDSVVWTDKPIRMSRDEYREDQDADLLIRLPKHVGKIQVGFGEVLDQIFPSERHDGWAYVTVPLESFVD